jgi:hypothetical protein
MLTLARALLAANMRHHSGMGVPLPFWIHHCRGGGLRTIFSAPDGAVLGCLLYHVSRLPPTIPAICHFGGISRAVFHHLDVTDVRSLFVFVVVQCGRFRHSVFIFGLRRVSLNLVLSDNACIIVVLEFCVRYRHYLFLPVRLSTIVCLKFYLRYRAVVLARVLLFWCGSAFRFGYHTIFVEHDSAPAASFHLVAWSFLRAVLGVPAFSVWSIKRRAAFPLLQMG